MRGTGSVLLLSWICGTALAQPPTTMLFEDLTGHGGFAHVGTFLVSSVEALAAYAAHPWSRQGTSELSAPRQSGGSPRVGYGDRFAEFLRVTYPTVPETTAGSACAQHPYVSLATGCGFGAPCSWGNCDSAPRLWWYVAYIGCPGAYCPSGGCGRTTNTVTAAVLAGGVPCTCISPFAGCAPTNPIQVVSYTTNGPLCECVNPPQDCVPIGPSDRSGQLTSSLTCVTRPRIGSTFNLSWTSGSTTSYLVLGPGLSSPVSWSGCSAENTLWVVPHVVMGPITSPTQVDVVIPNDAQLVGFVISAQAALYLSWWTGFCWRPTEGIRITIQP